MSSADDLRVSLTRLESILGGMNAESDDVNLRELSNTVLRGAYWVLQTRAIPRGRFKALEMVVRSLEGLAAQWWNYSPGEVMAWRKDHGHRLQLLHEALRWRERALGRQMVDCGGITLHNTVGVGAERFEELCTQVMEVSESLRGVGDFHRVLYGSVYLVGHIVPSKDFKNRRGWYDVGRDEVYFRDTHPDPGLLVAHELGHRYWFRFMDQSRRDRVESLYQSLMQEIAAIPPPALRIGERSPAPLDESGARPVVTEIARSYVVFDNGWERTRRSVERCIAEDFGVGEFFPDWYAKKNVEEFFAECFAYDLVEGLPQSPREKWRAWRSL